MGKHEKRVYLEAIRKRYRRSRRTDKGMILDEFCSVRLSAQVCHSVAGKQTSPVTTQPWAAFTIQPTGIVDGVAQAMACVTDNTKSKLRTLHKMLNPFDLKQQINAKLRHIFSMVKVTSVMRQDPELRYPFVMRQRDW